MQHPDSHYFQAYDGKSHSNCVEILHGCSI